MKISRLKAYKCTLKLIFHSFRAEYIKKATYFTLIKCGMSFLSMYVSHVSGGSPSPQPPDHNPQVT